MHTIWSQTSKWSGVEEVLVCLTWAPAEPCWWWPASPSLLHERRTAGSPGASSVCGRCVPHTLNLNLFTHTHTLRNCGMKPCQTINIFPCLQEKTFQTHLSYATLQKNRNLVWRDTPPQIQGHVGLMVLLAEASTHRNHRRRWASREPLSEE